MRGTDGNRSGISSVKSALASLVILICSNASADSWCIRNSSYEAPDIDVGYALSEDFVRFNFIIDVQGEFNSLAESEIYYDVRGSAETVDELEESGYALQAPLAWYQGESDLSVRIFTRRAFEKFVVLLVLNPGGELGCECPEYELLTISPSQINYSERYGDISLAR